MSVEQQDKSIERPLGLTIRRATLVAATLPLLQIGSCTQVDMQSAITAGFANYAISQFTIGADTVLRNILGV